MEGKARTGDGKEISPGAGVIPILMEVGELQLRVIGTGFFLTRYGLFATAKHVLEELVDWETMNLKTGFVFQDEPPHFLIRQIVGVSLSNNADMAIGQADNGVGGPNPPGSSNRYCRLSFTRPASGEELVNYAYPENEMLDFRDHSHPPILRGAFMSGRFLQQVASGERPYIPYPHYETSLEIRGGASGSPIFNSAGRVVGIACRGWDFRGSEHEGDNLSSILPMTQFLPMELACARIPSDSWEFSQIPIGRRSATLTFAELVTYGHVDVGALGP